MAIDWTRIYSKYKGQWVALKDDEKTVVGHGKKLSEAMKRAKKRGYRHPIMTKVPTKLVTYIG